MFKIAYGIMTIIFLGLSLYSQYVGNLPLATNALVWAVFAKIGYETSDVDS